MLDINPFTIIEMRMNRLESLLVDISKKLSVAGGNNQSYPPDKKLNIEELAEYTGIKLNTLRGMVSRGEIPAAKPGKRLIFVKSKIDKWLEDNRKKTAAEIRAEAEEFLSLQK